MMQSVTSDTNNTIRTFWHGPQLSIYEHLCLRSFVRYGHPVEVYSYDDLKVPDGVHLRDAGEILSRGELFTYASGDAKGEINAFSDVFRYALLYQKGGIWIDTDVLCLRSFMNLPVNCVGLQSKDTIAIGVMKFRKGEKICQELFHKARALDKKQVKWSETGPELITSLLQANPNCHVLPPSAFYPIPWEFAWKLLDPTYLEECESQSRLSYCVHWWNSILRLMGYPKQVLPPKGSYLYQKALQILDCVEADAWPEPLVSTWIKNYRNSELALHLHRPITNLLKSNPRMLLQDSLLILEGAKRRIYRGLRFIQI